VAWTRLFGLVSFDLFGPLVGMCKTPGALFDRSVMEMSAFVGTGQDLSVPPSKVRDPCSPTQCRHGRHHR
jgi:hypothetical protein